MALDNNEQLVRQAYQIVQLALRGTRLGVIGNLSAALGH
jgi:hypothetical protein